MQVRSPDRTALEQVFRCKHGPPEGWGWGPTLRLRAGYFTPDDFYEALMASLVVPGTAWLDLGCGRELFPSNRPLAELLAARTSRLVGVDPDATLQENVVLRERVASSIDSYDGGGAFDLVSLRMVAEHVADPAAVARAVARALKPGGLCVVYTVFSYSPVPLLTRLLPMGLRHRLKALLWDTQRKDTFPTRFRMNTRGALRRTFAGAGLGEELFLRLDDCRTTSRWRLLQQVELDLRRLSRWFGLPYAEHCLLGAYRKPVHP